MAKKPVELRDVVWIIWTHQKVDIDEVSFHRTGVESQLDIWEQEVTSVKPSLLFLCLHSLVGPSNAIVGDPDGRDRR